MRDCGLCDRGAENVRAGRGRGGVSGGEGPESELEVEITEAFLLRADRFAGMEEFGEREGL